MTPEQEPQPSPSPGGPIISKVTDKLEKLATWMPKLLPDQLPRDIGLPRDDVPLILRTAARDLRANDPTLSPLAEDILSQCVQEYRRWEECERGTVDATMSDLFPREPAANVEDVLVAVKLLLRGGWVELSYILRVESRGDTHELALVATERALRERA